jgi:hypothetical protein
MNHPPNVYKKAMSHSVRNIRPGNLLALLGLLALLFHAFIPTGMMPDLAARTAGFHLMICDGTMPSMMVADMPMDGMATMPSTAHGHPAHPGHNSAPMPCPYFMAALAAWILLPILIAIALARQRIEQPLLFVIRLRDGAIPGIAAPRGPPAL